MESELVRILLNTAVDKGVVRGLLEDVFGLKLSKLYLMSRRRMAW